MKNLLKITLSLLFIAASFTSCVDDKNFDTPQVACDDAKMSAIPSSAITSIENLLNQWSAINPTDYDANRVDFVEYNSVSDNALYIEGYVISSDLKGSFYKELFIQDKKQNPNYGIKIAVDLRGSYSKFPIGTKILIRINNLSINKVHGEMVIGEKDADSNVGAIRKSVADKIILRSCTLETIIPIEVNSVSEINDGMLGKYIKLINSQFHMDVLGLPFANPNDSYDSYRKIVFCSDSSYLKLETSSFASYAEQPLTSKKMSISGILSRDYGDDFYVLRLNSPNDIETNDSSRCDPIIEDLNCGDVTVVGTQTIFEENFNSVSNDGQLETMGWTNININEGDNKWKLKSYQGAKYMQLGAYNSNENPLEGWLVTPAINLDNHTDITLTFDVKAGYYNGDTLTVYVLTDFTGDVTTANRYTITDLTLPTGPSSGYGSFMSAGDINLSCLDGDVYIAFKYFGGDGAVTTTTQIDNIKITGN